MARDVLLPGGRADIRERSTTVVMHMLRRFLRGEGDGRPLSPVRARMFVALDLPEDERAALAALAGRPRRGDGTTCGRWPRTSYT